MGQKSTSLGKQQQEQASSSLGLEKQPSRICWSGRLPMSHWQPRRGPWFCFENLTLTQPGLLDQQLKRAAGIDLLTDGVELTWRGVPLKLLHLSTLAVDGAHDVCDPIFLLWAAADAHLDNRSLPPIPLIPTLQGSLRMTQAYKPRLLFEQERRDGDWQAASGIELRPYCGMLGRFQHAIILAPECDNPYRGGEFHVLVDLLGMPSCPPAVRFITPIWHPNIDPKVGQVLHFGHWQSACSVDFILCSLRAMLARPFSSSTPAAATSTPPWTNADRLRAQRHTRRYAMPPTWTPDAHHECSEYWNNAAFCAELMTVLLLFRRRQINTSLACNVIAWLALPSLPFRTLCECCR